MFNYEPGRATRRNVRINRHVVPTHYAVALRRRIDNGNRSNNNDDDGNNNDNNNTNHNGKPAPELRRCAGRFLIRDELPQRSGDQPYSN